MLQKGSKFLINSLHVELDVCTCNLMPCNVKNNKEQEKPKQIGNEKEKFH